MNFQKVFKKHTQPLIFAALLLVAYVPSFLWMWHRWFARDSYYSHGILVPFVTGYLIWQRRKELAAVVPERSGWGMALIILGLLGYLFSSLFRIYFTSGFSLLLEAFGFVLYFYGPRVMRLTLFPVFFLFFMLPLPLVIIVNMSFRLKLFVASIAVDMLHRIGLQAVQSGSIIVMQHAHVVVDDICSGLRSLISLGALGSIFAYWLKGRWWKRILLFLLTIPIAVVTNVCRVVLLSSVSEIWGTKYAEGTFHDATGLLVFVLAFIMLYACMRIIE